MIKIAGALMIGFACAFLGTQKSLKIKKRHKSLINMQKMLEILGTKIDFLERDIKTALEEIDSMIDSCGFLNEVTSRMGEVGLKRAWLLAVSKKKDALCFNDEDADTLAMAAARLGMTDSRNQLKNIEYVKNMLDIHIKSASYDVENLCRLYSGGGVLLGAFLIMMFL